MAFRPVENFLDADSFVQETVKRIREAVGDQKVYIAVSGGVDSSAVAAMIYDAIGDRVAAEHYDHVGRTFQISKRIKRNHPSI